MNNQAKRQNENNLDSTQDRSDRFNLDYDGYHYKTREGEHRGPFATQSTANYDLNCFIRASQLEKELLDQNFVEVS